MDFNPVYAATKAAVVNFTRSLGHLAASHGIRVNALAPAFVDTPLVRQIPEQIRNQLVADAGGFVPMSQLVAALMALVEVRMIAAGVLSLSLSLEPMGVQCLRPVSLSSDGDGSAADAFSPPGRVEGGRGTESHQRPHLRVASTPRGEALTRSSP